MYFHVVRLTRYPSGRKAFAAAGALLPFLRIIRQCSSLSDFALLHSLWKQQLFICFFNPVWFKNKLYLIVRRDNIESTDDGRSWIGRIYHLTFCVTQYVILSIRNTTYLLERENLIIK
jgi:hypothetical protein